MCSNCEKPFTKNVMNVDGEPYCDKCGRKAFVKYEQLLNLDNIRKRQKLSFMLGTSWLRVRTKAMRRRGRKRRRRRRKMIN